MNKLLVTILICLACCFVFNSSKGQDTGQDPIGQVRWVSEFPIAKKDKEKDGFFKRVGKFITGKKEITLSKPVAVFAEKPDVFWVLDQGNGAVLYIEDEEVKVPQFFTKKTNQFPSLVGICPVGENELLFTDSRLNKIFITTNDKNEYRVLNDSLHLQQPTGIAWSPQTKEIWVVETGAHRIAVLNEAGEILKYIGKRGEGPEEFNFPTHIWMDEDGNVYIVDSMNFRVQIFSSSGDWLSMFGSLGDATGYFSRPKGAATDSQGNIYVVDGLFHVVQVFSRSGDFLYYFGGQGRAKGHFWLPSGIYIDNRDYIYVADSYNSRIQVFQFLNEAIK